MNSFQYAKRSWAAQARLLRGNWALDHELTRDEYRSACGAEASRFIDAFARCDSIQELSVKADAQIMREDGQIFLLFSILPVAVVRIGSELTSVDLNGSQLGSAQIDKLCKATPGLPRSQIEYAVKQVNQEILEFQGIGSASSSGEAFWSKHNEFTITRAQVKAALSTDPIDYADAFNRIFGWGEPVHFDFTRAPHRWSPLTLSRVGEYLAGGVSPDACDSFGVTALNAAVKYGRHPWVAPLLRAGADVDLADASGMNPVSTTVADGDVGMLDVLVRAGANPNGSRFAPSLAVASLRSDAVELITRLVGMGADPHQMLPVGRRLSEDLEVISLEPVRRVLASLATQRTLEGAFEQRDEPSAPADGRSDGMTL